MKSSLLYFGALWLFFAASLCGASGIPMIIDADMESDVDDVGAMAMVHALADSGEIDLLGMMICATNSWSTLSADRINTYFGRGALPLGRIQRSGVYRYSVYAQHIAEEFTGDLASAGDAPDAVDLYRELLAAEEDASVVIVSIGYTTNLRDLLASEADAHSALTGLELVSQKVRAWVCMGGQFPAGRESNIRLDTDASVEVISAWPTPIIFAGWEVGNMDTGSDILSLPTSNPVRRAYQLFGKIPHKSWDQVAVLYAARGLDDGPSAAHWQLSAPGEIVIDPSDGSNTWTSSAAGQHQYLVQQSSNAVIAAEIDELMLHLPVGSDPAGYLLSTSRASVLAGGEVTISAQLVDERGLNVYEAGRTVNWYSTNGGTFSATQTLTDATGEATVVFTSIEGAAREYSVTMEDADDLSLNGNSVVIATFEYVDAIAQYSFGELAGTSVEGNAIINYGIGGVELNLTNTGGPDGRNFGGGGYGAAGYAGAGSAFNVPASGDGATHSWESATGGGLLSAETVLQSRLQGESGAFTYEALIQLSSLSGEQTIISHDGPNGSCGFLFRVISGNLSFYPGFGSELLVPIPTTDAHAFVANEWFHLAVTYNGNEGTPGNVEFYWTRLDDGDVRGYQIGTGTLTSDLDGAISNYLGIGTTTRDYFRFELDGSVDEVRLSAVARSAEELVFSSEPLDSDDDGLPDSWELSYGLDPEVANVDTSGDGMSDLIKFALGLDPRLSDLTGLPQVEPVAGYLTLTANRNPDASHLQFEVEVSGDLEQWDRGVEHVTILQDSASLLQVRDNVSISDVTRRFMRLKLTVP